MTDQSSPKPQQSGSDQTQQNQPSTNPLLNRPHNPRLHISINKRIEEGYDYKTPSTKSPKPSGGSPKRRHKDSPKKRHNEED
jgi:hypothetical protein